MCDENSWKEIYALMTRGAGILPDWHLMLEQYFNSSPLPRACGLHAALLALVLALGGCRLATGLDDDQLVGSLRFSPSAFDSFRRNTELRYTLSAPADVRVRIIRRGASGEEIPVKTLADRLHVTKGAHAITWLGDTAERLFAPAGIYVGVVEIGETRFEATVEVFHF